MVCSCLPNYVNSRVKRVAKWPDKRQLNSSQNTQEQLLGEGRKLLGKLLPVTESGCGRTGSDEASQRYGMPGINHRVHSQIYSARSGGKTATL